jgi:hypothetical protein
MVCTAEIKKKNTELQTAFVIIHTFSSLLLTFKKFDPVITYLLGAV